jgi:bifunctional DNA-binding transcriptional regulator/antitoxin component of YhaV-PrlF toxin-antitoxin module
MSRKSLKEKFNRKIIKAGQRSFTLPKEYLEDLDWKKGKRS